MANKWLDNLKDLWDRLTATRAGYIDELDFDLNARLGTPAGASLAADLLTIDNFVDDLETAVGAIEGATTLHNKLTAARAGYLDYINNADLANLIRDVAQATGTFAFDESAAGEQTIFSIVVAARAKVGAIWLDLNTLTLNNTIRIKHKIDGATYRTFSTHAWVFATDDKGVLLEGFTAYRDFQVSMQCAGGGAAGKNVPYAVV